MIGLRSEGKDWQIILGAERFGREKYGGYGRKRLTTVKKAAD